MQIEPFTLLIAGHRIDRLTSDSALALISATLHQQLQNLIHACRAAGYELRILTGVASGADTLAAEVAMDLGIEVHLLSPEAPPVLTPAQARATRQLWLHQGSDHSGDEQAVALRDNAALCLADGVLVLWDGQRPQGILGGTVRLATQAALAMKPLTWIDLSGR